MRNHSPSTFALWLTLGLVPLAAAAFATGCSDTSGDGATASADALGACGRGSGDDADDDADEDDGDHGKGALHANCGKARRDAGKTTTSDAGSIPTSDAGSTTTDAGSPPTPDAGSTPPTCTSFTYSAFGPCQPNGTQTRTVVTSSPAGCTGGTPVLTQTCTYVDGAALYTQYCAGCHGTSKKGSSATSIQSAIDKNTGGMGSLKFLTADQIQAISAAK